ncbi:T9SS type A sorting domain-containing protein [Phormidium tenue FACHB-886]|nr:T9SS type A sorting domain-containing protein [Phormidium tenue FACHB-886]
MRTNGNFKSAQTRGTVNAIELKSGEQQTYQGQVSSAGADRLYRLRINQRSSFQASLTNLNANANLTLLNSRGKTLKASAKGGQANESINRRLAKGTYFIRVSGQQGSTAYKLQLAAVDALQNGTRSSADANNSALVQRVVELTNLQRSQAGLAPLKLNAKLSNAAYVHSRDMALRDFFSHTGSDGSNVTNRIREAGYRSLNAGENIAAGYATAEAVVEGWMNSPGHRANILFPNVKEIGVGFYFLSNDSGAVLQRYYWTQDFATPA